MGSREEFIAGLYPAARRVSQETGMSWELILAQAAQETGWGQRVLPGTNNIFNIKADPSWDGPSRTFNVPEYVNGRRVMLDQPFRVYDSVDDALRDRVQFLRENPRYTEAGLFREGVAGNLEGEAAALQRGRYATDPRYAEALVEVFNGPTMRRSLALARERNPDEPAVAERPAVAPEGARVGATPSAGSSGTWPAPGNYTLNERDQPGEGRPGWHSRTGGAHRGVDIQGDEGDSIRAFRGGVATAHRQQDGAGDYIQIQHDDGSVSKYFHLQRGSLNPPLGSDPVRVEEGQEIGRMGRTGNVPAAGDTHLHFELWRGGRDVDPMPALNGARREGQAPGSSAPEGIAQTRSASSAMADGVLKAGDRGPEVVALQERLNTLGYRGQNGEPLETRTGLYGPQTEHAVREFQRAHGLEVDGKAGQGQTLPALERAGQAPLVSEATHTSHSMFMEVNRRITEQTGQAPSREAGANVVMQMMENGFRNEKDVKDLAVRGTDVHVQGPGPGSRVSVDLAAPTADLQSMSDHMSKQALEQQERQRTQQQGGPTVMTA